MKINEFIGGGFKEMLGKEIEVSELERGAIMTVDEAEDLFYKTHDCLSDDADAEQGRIERWCEDMNITVTD